MRKGRGKASEQRPVIIAEAEQISFLRTLANWRSCGIERNLGDPHERIQKLYLCVKRNESRSPPHAWGTQNQILKLSPAHFIDFGRDFSVVYALDSLRFTPVIRV